MYLVRAHTNVAAGARRGERPLLLKYHAVNDDVGCVKHVNKAAVGRGMLNVIVKNMLKVLNGYVRAAHLDVSVVILILRGSVVENSVYGGAVDAVEVVKRAERAVIVYLSLSSSREYERVLVYVIYLHL